MPSDPKALVIGMAKLPKASVALPEVMAIGLPGWTVLGSDPPMRTGFPLTRSPGVVSRIVTQVALPKPVISLSPSMVGLAVETIGLPDASVPAVLAGATATDVGKSIGARLMAKAPWP